MGDDCERRMGVKKVRKSQKENWVDGIVEGTIGHIHRGSHVVIMFIMPSRSRFPLVCGL